MKGPCFGILIRRGTSLASFLPEVHPGLLCRSHRLQGWSDIEEPKGLRVKGLKG